MGTEGGDGPIVAQALRCSEMPNVYCNRRWKHVRSTCNLLPVYLVGPVKQWIHMSKENLHILSQSLSSVSLGRNVYFLHCAMYWAGSGKPFQQSLNRKKTSSLIAGPQKWTLLAHLWQRCPTCFFVLLYVHLILLWPFSLFCCFSNMFCPRFKTSLST